MAKVVDLSMILVVVLFVTNPISEMVINNYLLLLESYINNMTLRVGLDFIFMYAATTQTIALSLKIYL